MIQNNNAAGFSQLIHILPRVLGRDPRVVFAYLYGSLARGESGRDVDIAVYAKDMDNPFQLSADLKHDLYLETALGTDAFDIRILNSLDRQSDLFGLLYLKSLLTQGILLVDKDPEIRAGFLERYGTRYRECEGLIKEILA